MQLSPELEAIVYGENRAALNCPGCGRYLGAYERCAFCRLLTPKTGAIRLLKYGSPVLAVIGFFLLLWMARAMGHPDAKIRDLGPRTNMARVRLVGRVTDIPRLYDARSGDPDDAGAILFPLDDGTGEIRIRAYDTATAELARAHKFPALGDEVTAVVAYQQRPGGGQALLDGERALTIRRSEPDHTAPIREFVRPAPNDHGALDGRRVRVTGRVALAPTKPWEGALRFDLDDPLDRHLEVHVWEGMLKLSGAARDFESWSGRPQRGDFLTVTGALLYNDYTRRWLLVPATPADLRPADRDAWEADNAVK